MPSLRILSFWQPPGVPALFSSTTCGRGRADATEERVGAACGPPAGSPNPCGPLTETHSVRPHRHFFINFIYSFGGKMHHHSLLENKE